MVLALCAFLLLGGFITYLVLTMMKDESDYDDTWEELSTFSKIYWDNEQSSMVNTHKRNMICICAFAIFEGILYVIQFFCMIGFLISNPEFYITTRLPQLSKGGVDKLEYQPFKETLRKIDRKKKKKAQAKKDGDKEEESEEKDRIGGAMDVMMEAEEYEAMQGFQSPNKSGQVPPGSRGMGTG